MMKKISLVLVAIMASALSSCVTHYFAEPVPTDAKDYSYIPKAMQGSWATENELHTIGKNKWISEEVDSLGNKTTTVEFELSDSLIVKRFKRYYFFNSLEKNGYWAVYFGFKQGNRFFIMGLGDDDTITLASSIELLPDSICNDNEHYFNTPFTKKLMRKFIADGGFADTLIVFDVDNRTMNKLD